MSFPPNLIHAVGTSLVVWVLWKAYSRFCLSPLNNIVGPPSDSFFKGNYLQFFGNNTREYAIGLLKRYGAVTKITLFWETQLVVSDPKALHSILVKDQNTYSKVPSSLTFTRILFGPGLTSTTGEQHRKQRKMLNPVFSTSHLREMVPILYDVAETLRDTIAGKVKDGPQEIEIMEWMSRTAMEMIGQSGFGYSFDGLKEDSVPHSFSACVRRFEVAVKGWTFARFYLLPTLSKIGTRKFQSFMVRLLPWKGIRATIELVDSMHNTSVDIINARKMAINAGKEVMDGQVGRGKDIISVLLQANERAETSESLSNEEVLAQVSLLTAASMDTTISALLRTLWIIAQRQDVQENLRLEIREARKGWSNFGYDELMNLSYLDAVCKETLRLYPPLTTVFRESCQDAVLPLGTPIKGIDGTEIHEIPIPKGSQIILNLSACNTDPAIWGEDSDEWKPERFQQLPESVASAHIPGVFSHLMTFLGGIRGCIGFRFSQLEMKLVLLLLIESFKFSVVQDKEIHWVSRAIAKPGVVGVPGHQLPLVVERVQ